MELLMAFFPGRSFVHEMLPGLELCLIGEVDENREWFRKIIPKGVGFRCPHTIL